MSVAANADVSYQVEPLAGGFAARVVGASVTALAATDLVALIAEHGLVFFDEPALDDAGQHEVVAALGDPYIHPMAIVAGATEAKIGHIVDDEDHPPFQDSWHTDVTWDPSPPVIGSLRCIEMPARGGNTIWGDMTAAYDALSPAFRDRLDDLIAWHDAGAGEAFASKGGADMLAKAREQFPGAEHPVIGTHPVTGRRYINVNSSFTRRIVGMTRAESQSLLQFLIDHCDHPNWQYRHRWQVGEFCVWDERSTQHYAVADHYPARREMARFVVR